MLRTKDVQGYVALLVLAVAVALLAVSGCGGDDESSADTAGAVAAQDGGEGASDGTAQEDGEVEGGEGGASEGAAVDGAGNGSAGEGAAGGGSAGGGGSGAQAGGGNAGLQGGSARGRSGKSGRARRGGAGGEGGESSGSVPPSAEAFFEQADAICQEKREDTRQNLADYTNAGLSNLEKNAADITLKLVIPNLEAEMQEIQALNPPASASAAVSALLAAIEEMIAFGKDNPKGFLISGETVAKSEEAAKANGFKVCGGI